MAPGFGPTSTVAAACLASFGGFRLWSDHSDTDSAAEAKPDAGIGGFTAYFSNKEEQGQANDIQTRLFQALEGITEQLTEVSPFDKQTTIGAAAAVACILMIAILASFLFRCRKSVVATSDQIKASSPVKEKPADTISADDSQGNDDAVEKTGGDN